MMCREDEAVAVAGHPDDGSPDKRPIGEIEGGARILIDQLPEQSLAIALAGKVDIGHIEHEIGNEFEMIPRPPEPDLQRIMSCNHRIERAAKALAIERPVQNHREGLVEGAGGFIAALRGKPDFLLRFRQRRR
ncbi:hypothetical protein FQZ97_1025560 [compost metagenome]